MIALTKLNRQEILLNSDLIEVVEETPDTVILLTNGHGLHVRETRDEVLRRVIEFRRAIAGQTGSNIHPMPLKQEYPPHGDTENNEA